MGHGNLLKVFVVADINSYLHFPLRQAQCRLYAPPCSQFSVRRFQLAVGSYRK